MALNLSNYLLYNNKMLNFFIKMNKIYKENIQSCNMDMCSIFNVIEIVYNGTAGEQRKSLDENTNLKTILKMLPKSQVSRKGIFIRNDYIYNETFRNKYESEIYIDNIPRNETERKKINNAIQKKFSKWPKDEDCNEDEFFKELLDYNIFLYIKDESYFNGNWVYPFVPDDTRMKPFYCGNEKVIKIPMMMRQIDTEIYTYKCEDTKSLFISLEYENDYKMLVILPDEPCNKQQLILFCENNLIDDKLDKYILKLRLNNYKAILMPKFNIESEWDFNRYNNDDDDNDDDKTPYLSEILNTEFMDFSNISKRMKGESETMNLRSISKINNNEIGTKVLTDTLWVVTDGIIRQKHLLFIERSFIYMIMDKNNAITNIGIFVG